MIALALFLLVEGQTASADSRPTNAALQRVYETNRSLIVEVVGDKRSGIGIILGAGGEVLTSIDYVGSSEAKVKFAGRELPARVVLSDPKLKFALLEITAPGSFPSGVVKVYESIPDGSQVLAILKPHSRKPAVAVANLVRVNADQSPLAEADIALPPGTPVFDEKGRLIALAVQQLGKKRSLILPLAAIKARLAPLVSE